MIIELLNLMFGYWLLFLKILEKVEIFFILFNKFY